MRTLGLDPSLTGYGWCVYDSCPERRQDSLVASGHERTYADAVPVARLMHVRALVADLLRRFAVSAVGVESPAYNKDDQFAKIHYSLMMYSLEAAFLSRKDVVLFDPTTVKFLTGNKSATKQDMQKFVQLDRMSADLVQSDEADAYCVARATARFVALRNGDLRPEDLTQNERRTFLERSRKRKTAFGQKTVRTGHLFQENSRYFAFSKIPAGDINLPSRSQIDPGLLRWLEADVPSEGPCRPKQ